MARLVDDLWLSLAKLDFVLRAELVVILTKLW